MYVLCEVRGNTGTIYRCVACKVMWLVVHSWAT